MGMVIAMRLTAAITREDDWYVAKCLEVDIASQGETLEAAMENLKEALELYYEDGFPVDPVITPIIAPLEVEIKP